jgi:hypothetical protein
VCASFKKWDVIPEEPLLLSFAKLATSIISISDKRYKSDRGKDVCMTRRKALMLKKNRTWCMENFDHKPYYTMLRASFKVTDMLLLGVMFCEVILRSKLASAFNFPLSSDIPLHISMPSPLLHIPA